MAGDAECAGRPKAEAVAELKGARARKGQGMWVGGWAGKGLARAMSPHPRDRVVVLLAFGAGDGGWGMGQHGVLLLRRRAATARQRTTHHGAPVLSAEGRPSATARVGRARTGRQVAAGLRAARGG
jgi:hypothetical protein